MKRCLLLMCVLSLLLTLPHAVALFGADDEEIGEAPAKAPVDALEYRGDPQRTGYFPKGLGDKNPFGKNKAVIFAATQEKAAYALDAASGRELWTVPLPERIYNSPVICQGVLYIGCINGSFLALNAADGAELWRKEFKGAYYGTPMLYQEKLYFANWSAPKAYCVDAKNGEVLWEQTLNRQAYSTCAILGENVFFGDYTGKLYAFNLETGEEQWQTQVGKNIYSPIGVQGKTLVLSTQDSQLHAVNADSGETLWSSPINSFSYAAPVFDGTTVYYSTYGNKMGSGSLYAFNLETGAQLWETSLESQAMGTPILANNQLIVSTANGAVLGFDPKNGDKIFSHEVEFRMNASPAYYQEKLYVCGTNINESKMLCLDLKSGKISWTSDKNMSVYISFIVAD